MESWGLWLFADQAAAMVVPHSPANPGSTSPKVSAGRAALAIVTASPRELHALQGKCKAISGLLCTAYANCKALGLDVDWCWEKPFIALEILL